MKLAIMQPYFFPYIGYFQLINAVDEFVIYDEIEFSKKGWINRNRILVNGYDKYITIPLKKASDYFHVKDRYLADSWTIEKNKILNRIKESYCKAEFFKEGFLIVEQAILFENYNLFEFVYNSVKLVNNYLGINTPIIKVSEIPIFKKLKSADKVIEICKLRNADVYINPIGGTALYTKESFLNQGIELFFLKTDNIVYKQFNNEFIQFLSIIDVMMFNSKEEIINMLNNYSNI